MILHLGAKARELGPQGLAIADPAGLLKWLARDRAMVVFADRAAVERQRQDFAAIVRDWIGCVG